MKHRLHVLILATVVALSSCTDDPAPIADMDARIADGGDVDREDIASPDADSDAGPDTSEQAFPDEITTSGASFGGPIAAGDEIELALVANEGDHVVLWLRMDGEPAWNPSVSIFRQGDTEAMVYGNPQGNADAHIPYQASELDQGWEFFEGGRYRLSLENFADVGGRFAFTLECISGPCTDATDTDGDGVVDSVDNCASEPNLEQADSDGDGVGDVCDPDTVDDPYEGLNDAGLEQAMRTQHQGHTTFSYNRARDHLFATVDNVDGFVECVYTGEKIETNDRTDAFNKGFNTEHTWPQSRGADDEPAKSDMHHLFPATAESNQYRSNNFFGDVTGNVSWSVGDSKLGEDASGATRFEPREVHKGNVARAMFYFAVIYQHDIPAFEEETLRQWHSVDPVDATEQARNQAVADIQNSRNPFVDQPDLVERIADF